jgi:hypothetical protein
VIPGPGGLSTLLLLARPVVGSRLDALEACRCQKPEGVWRLSAIAWKEGLLTWARGGGCGALTEFFAGDNQVSNERELYDH